MSERIARRAAQKNALGVIDTRGARFAQSWSGAKGPVFCDMVAVPRWLMLARDQQEKVAQAAGLMQHRAAINQELSGPRLAILAQAVGEDLLDAVCAEDLAEDLDDGVIHKGPLPRPDLIVNEGWDVMRRGLPTVFALRFPDARGDAAARAASERAVDLVLAL
jgi:hypothetical protein